jgi:hypothetical protein
MQILINSHPTAKPCFGVSETLALDIVASDTTGTAEVYTWVREVSAPDTDPLNWIYTDVMLQTGATSSYTHTVIEADYGTKIRCIVSGRRSHAVELLPLEPMNKTSIARHAVPYAYVAGGAATLAFIPVGTNMTYEVFDPSGTSLEGPTACVNGETYVYTSGADPAEGTYTIVVTGDGGDAITGGEIRLFDTDSELLLWSRKQWVGNTGVYLAGYGDVGYEVQFGQIERNPWLIQQFTADLDDNVTMRLDNWAELPGAPATQEVSVDGLFHTVLTWVGTVSVDGVYTVNAPDFARHVRGAPEFSLRSTESMVLDFRDKPAYVATVTDVALGAAHSDYVYGYSPTFGAGSGDIGTTDNIEAIYVKDPDGQTTTEIVAKFADTSNVFSQFSMQLTLQETGDSCYLRMDPATNEAGTGTNTNWYRGVCDTNTPVMDNIGAALKAIVVASEVPVGAPVTATGDVTAGIVTNANTADSVAMTDVGGGYSSAPVVTFSTGTGGTATGTAVMTGETVTGITITTPGSYLDVELPITVAVAAPVAATATATFDVRIFN